MLAPGAHFSFRRGRKYVRGGDEQQIDQTVILNVAEEVVVPLGDFLAIVLEVDVYLVSLNLAAFDHSLSNRPHQLSAQ